VNDTKQIFTNPRHQLTEDYITGRFGLQRPKIPGSHPGDKSMSQPLEGHTVHRYDGELNTLHLSMLEMAGLVLEQTRLAVQALRNKNLYLAYEVIEREQEVDARELEVDQEILSLIARRAPVASDLRVLMSFSKAVTDLERIGDEAARIAYLTVSMFDNERSDPSASLLRDIGSMGALAINTLEQSIETFDNLDADRAESLANADDELDEEFQSGLRRLTTFVLEDARNVGHAINITIILKALERIGDHATNLAEYVVFLLRGKDIRHPEAKVTT
jgi:phosphate transport system protein